MICNGAYTSGFSHRWTKWQPIERDRVTEFLTCSTLTTPTSKTTTTTVEFFDSRECIRCGKTQQKRSLS